MKREIITEVAKITTGQTQNENWYLARKYRITASNFGSILACCARNRFPPSLFKSLMGKFNHIVTVFIRKSHKVYYN